MDFGYSALQEGERLLRNDIGEGKSEVDLLIKVEGFEEQIEISAGIEEQRRTKEEAQMYLSQAKDEIRAGIFQEGEDNSYVTEAINIEDSYIEGLVDADWSFSNYQIMNTDGSVIDENVPSEGFAITAEAKLTCGDYEDYFSTDFVVFPKEKSDMERIKKELEEQIYIQNQLEGEEYIYLPKRIDNRKLVWKQKREYLSIKILLLELLFFILYPFIKKEEELQREKERKNMLALQYPEILSKLTVLVGSGMTIRQAWNKISASYSNKRQKRETKERYVYEEMCKTNRAMLEGESERIAYQKFGERMADHAYYRLMRILISNLKKGNQGLCELLEEESEKAFEERTFAAKKYGEEASTKMIFPLILLMGIVMAIIIVPAITEFTI